ncbi:hypothetical protein A8926_3799 [Saccharopolyspora spinosa]|uniref:Uncharacterized protein n=1 Tax=Saccharopolyspora spinosa TaxID=60894 RepID=A0A2N3XZG4_SACSN|nr:hypothetical protein A8926_3799 [Saccharopolyspora spinosa]
MSTLSCRQLVSENNIAHYIQSGATRALCGVPLTNFFPPNSQRATPAPCSFCPSELARLRKKAAAQ